MNKYSDTAINNNDEANDKAAVDLTPMLDVVFILLIFFVVTATFTREFGIPVSLPLGLPPPVDKFESISVTVAKADTYIVNGRVVDRGGLAPYIMSLHVENPDAGFGLTVAEGTTVDATIFAADAARQAGFSTIPISRERRSAASQE